MLELSFKIISCYIDNNNIQKFKIYTIRDKYNVNMTLAKILKELYKKYGINNKDNFDYYIFHVNNLFWKQYLSNDLICALDYTLYDYERLTLGQLEKQFSISKLEIPIHLNYDGKGKAVGDKHGIRFFFNHNEKDLHHNPHIHCKYAEFETRIEITTLKVLDKPFKKTKMKYALNFVKKHQQELINYWNKVVVNGESLELKLDL